MNKTDMMVFYFLIPLALCLSYSIAFFSLYGCDYTRIIEATNGALVSVPISAIAWYKDKLM